MQNALKHFSQKQVERKLIPLFSIQRLSLTIICFGILVRLVQYLYNRSLWNDEAALALNIVNRSYLELLQPLDYEQGAPIGFLMVEKLAVQLLGDNEYALRLFPLLSSIISLFLLYELAKRCIQRQAIPIALALFVGLDYLLYFASEVKQYSTDVAIALLCCLLGMSLRNQKLSGTRQIATYSLVGAIAIWFSHPAIFVLAGVGASCFFTCLAKKDRKKLIKLIAIFSIWALSFLGLYFISLQNLNDNQYLMESWKAKAAFPTSLLDINWSYLRFIKMFTNPLGFPKALVLVPRLIFLAGCVSLWLRRKEILLFLMSPVFMTLIAGYLYKYPFRSRLILFLTPFVILIIAEGAEYIRKKTRSKFTFIIGILILGLLLAPPLANASYHLVNPYVNEEIKPVLSYLRAHQIPGDIVYVHQRAEYQFKFYAKKYGYYDGDYIMGIDDLDKYDGKGMSPQEWERYKSDFNKLRGNKRVWIILSHITHTHSEQPMILSYLDSIGKQVAVFDTKKSFVYLYDFSNPR